MRRSSVRINRVTVLAVLFIASHSMVFFTEFSHANVLPETIDGVAPGEMMTAYFRNLTVQAFERREAEYEATKSDDQLLERQKRMKEFFIEQLGGFPERTPLNAQIVGRREFDDYRIEKVIYESRPKHYVTAILYLPTARAPYPAVLFPCGHSTTGKGEGVYQRACILLAKNGFAVLCYDPIDQGERYQLLKPDGSPQIGGTTGHTMTGVGSILLGRNTATFRIWDGMRGVDYLVSRKDIDPKRIGCTGNSGGGTLTGYIMALDERITCAAPSCYITTLRNQSPQDAEQNVHAQIAFGMDHSDYIMMRAPKPTLMCTATRDFFDINGSWYAFRQAKRFYTRMGYPERIDLVETDEEHGYSVQLREGMTRWMLRWLRGIDAHITEPDFPILTDEEIQVSPKGQVMLMEGARTVYDLNRDLEDKYAKMRKQFWEENGKEKALEKVRELTGIEKVGTAPELVGFVEMGNEEIGELKVMKLILKPEKGISLPALFVTSKSAPLTNQIVLYLNGEGKNAAMVSGGAVENYVRERKSVFAVDLRGIGETARVEGNKGWQQYFGLDWPDYFSAYMLDKTYAGMRAQDILNCVLYLNRLRVNGELCKTHLVAVGQAGVPALHAAALEPQLFESVTIENSLDSWTSVIENDITKNQLINAVHGALRYYDLPDLAACVPEGKLTVVRPVDALGEAVK